MKKELTLLRAEDFRLDSTSESVMAPVVVKEDFLPCKLLRSTFDDLTFRFLDLTCPLPESNDEVTMLTRLSSFRL